MGKSLNQLAEENGLMTSDQPVNAGDLYLAGRNTGPHLLTCKTNTGSFIVPLERAYCYDLCDCVRIISDTH
jgi:hypothetical protein